MFREIFHDLLFSALYFYGCLYVTGTFTAILWIIYKHFMAHWHVRRRQNRSEMEFWLGERHSAGSVVQIVLVHGTWALKGSWHRQHSPFLRALESEMKSHPHLAVRVRRFLWTGGNTLTDRNRAVSQFVSEIDAFVQKDVTAPTFIVAHSHGGNVAVQALRAAPQIEQHVAGLITVATPFLVAHKRRGGWPYFFALIGGIVLAASSYFALVPAKLNISSSQSLWLAGVLVVLSMWMSFWQSKRVLRALLPDRQENPINRKLLVIRTSGDEAGASLGAAYMVAYSARVCARMVTAVVAYPARWLQDLLYWKADSQMSVRKELLLVFGGAVSCWIAASWHPQLEFAALAFWGCVGVAAALIVPIAVMWLLRLVWALVRICANGIFETAIAGMLIPFGPETFIAAPFVLVSAEAVPTTGEDLRDPVPVLQLPLKESALQHSFDRHQHELARIIVQFVGARSHLSKTPARAA